MSIKKRESTTEKLLVVFKENHTPTIDGFNYLKPYKKGQRVALPVGLAERLLEKEIVRLAKPKG